MTQPSFAKPSPPAPTDVEGRSRWAPEHLQAAVDALQIGLAAGLDGAMIRVLVEKHGQEVSVAAGKPVVRQGDPGNAMYLVLSGRLRAERSEGGERLVLGDVHPGELFGEVSIVTGQERMATVLATADSRLLRVDSAALEALEEAKAHVEGLAEQRIGWLETRRFRPRSETIFGTLEPFTGPLDAPTRAALETEITWLAGHRGTELIRQGTLGDCLYFVVTGRLEVLVDPGDGSALRVAEIGPGETAGEAALLTDEPRGATVRITRDAELLRLSRSGFERLLATHPKAMAAFARTMASRLQRGLRQRDRVAELRGDSLATPDGCDAIARTENLVLRNLKITQMYHRLSLDIARLIGQRDANWCTFATSASKTAGYSIRREEIPFIEAWRLLATAPQLERLFGPVGRGVARTSDRVGLSRRIDAVLDGVSAAISAGNLKVFAELAPLFARFVHAFHDERSYDRDAIFAFLDEHVRPGRTETGGQELLRDALTHYYDAMFERSEKARAELILLGNLKVGLHEQKRLQPAIEEALNVPIHIGLGGLLPFPGGRELEQRLAGRLVDPSRRMVTRLLMRLRLPRGDLRLGRDVRGTVGKSMFPDVLRALGNPELRTLVAQLDNDVETTRGSFATDWASLEQRMNFIVDFFRSWQRSLDLFESPFEYDQRLAMESELIPEGQL